jgi:hypothetical protein
MSYTIYMKNVKLLLPPFISLAIILITSAVIIAYGRGYRPTRPGTSNTIVKSTGLLSTTSDPVGAQVFVDGGLRTATNNSFNIDPGKKTVRISKEGYLSWQKDVVIEPEIVSRADAFLFPVNPSLSPLTNTGILIPTLSSDGNRIAYLIPPKDSSVESIQNAGLWIYDLVDRPLGFNRDPRKAGTWIPSWENNIPQLKWSPDTQQLLVSTPAEIRLYTVSKTDDLKLLTSREQEVLVDQWEKDRQIKELQQLSAFKQPFIDVATSSAKIIAFSPDETKILYEATASANIPLIITPPLVGTNSTPEQRSITPENIYIYDTKEDKNYFLLTTKELTPNPSPTPTRSTRLRPTPTPVPNKIQQYLEKDQLPIRWFPTNKHVVITLPGKIDILEYDRTNWVTVYAGPFVNNFVAPWPGGSRLIIVSNLNPGASPLPNLFTVNLR